MEITCHRCHGTILAENCYCPACGLPQLVYTADGPPSQASGEAQPEPWNEAVGDPSSVDWKRAIRLVLMLAIPAGVLSSGISPLSSMGLLWMSSAAAWVVVLYMRGRHPAWITIGAGARIGLVTGLLAGWLAFCISGGALFVERVVLHQSSKIDAEYYTTFVEKFQQRTQQSLAGMGTADAAQAQTILANMQAWLLSPEGHAGLWSASIAVSSLFLLLFAVGGGAMGAWMLARRRRREV